MGQEHPRKRDVLELAQIRQVVVRRQASRPSPRIRFGQAPVPEQDSRLLRRQGTHVRDEVRHVQALCLVECIERAIEVPFSLPDAELRKKFDAIGAKTNTPLVSYCMVGMRASVTYFVARHLGYDSRLYDGSIVDWTRRKLPAVTGK